jgi:hypothetical protein
VRDAADQGAPLVMRHCLSLVPSAVTAEKRREVGFLYTSERCLCAYACQAICSVCKKAGLVMVVCRSSH